MPHSIGQVRKEQKKLENGIAMPRPNLITSDEKTIRRIDEIWDNLNLGDFIESPSLKYKKITPGYEGYLYDK
jgi:4-hydroxy-3-polyprenylbenzoate decarboxylase